MMFLDGERAFIFNDLTNTINEAKLALGMKVVRRNIEVNGDAPDLKGSRNSTEIGRQHCQV